METAQCPSSAATAVPHLGVPVQDGLGVSPHELPLGRLGVGDPLEAVVLAPAVLPRPLPHRAPHPPGARAHGGGLQGEAGPRHEAEQREQQQCGPDHGGAQTGPPRRGRAYILGGQRSCITTSTYVHNIYTEYSQKHRDFPSVQYTACDDT